MKSRENPLFESFLVWIVRVSFEYLNHKILQQNLSLKTFEFDHKHVKRMNLIFVKEKLGNNNEIPIIIPKNKSFLSEHEKFSRQNLL